MLYKLQEGICRERKVVLKGVLLVGCFWIPYFHFTKPKFCEHCSLCNVRPSNYDACDEYISHIIRKEDLYLAKIVCAGTMDLKG